MSKAAIAGLAKEIYDTIISKNIRRKELDLNPHVFVISEASMKDGFGAFLGLEDETEINTAIKILTQEFKRIAKQIVPKAINPVTFEGYDASKNALHHIELGNSLLILARTYKTLSDGFLYKVRTKLGGEFKDKIIKFNVDGRQVQATNILGTETIYLKGNVPNQKRYTDIGHTAAFGREERNTPLGEKLGRAYNKLVNSNIEGAAQLSSQVQNFIRSLTEIHGAFTVETRKDISALNTLAANKNTIGIGSFVITLPQHYTLNQKELGDVEDQIYKKFEKVFADLKGSPSILEMMWNAILSTFQTGKYKPAKYSTKATHKFDKKGKPGIGHTFKKQPPIRDIGGKFFSVLKLQNLINAQLHDRLKKNMGQGFSTERLNYRTGRFAKSAKVTAITPSDQLLTTYYTYMKYPYATFAPGGKQYRGDGRDPELLINMSIREIAIGLVSKQFKVVPKVV